MSAPPEVIVYSRQGCHLCDVVKDKLRKLEKHASFAWREVDIDTDPDLVSRFNDEVPVVFIAGTKAFKYTLDEREFLRRLQARG
jgi:glutaredoxin